VVATIYINKWTKRLTQPRLQGHMFQGWRVRLQSLLGEFDSLWPCQLIMNSNEYMRQYMLQRYHRRRNQAIKMLDGKCVKCEETTNLHIDHIDPFSKSFGIAKGLSGFSEKRILKELKKNASCCVKNTTLKRIKKMFL